MKKTEGRLLLRQPAFFVAKNRSFSISGYIPIDGILKPDEFRRFFEGMHRKYGSEEVRILYQSKLDIFLSQSVNG